MAVEARRGCGYRKIGGLYLCSDAPNRPCCRFPFELDICPVCNQGVKQSRNVQWFTPNPWIKGPCKFSNLPCSIKHNLPVSEKALLIWIGLKYYATPDHFLDEAKRMGISRRIKTVPRGFKLGETKVFFAHPACAFPQSNGDIDYLPGVFAMVVPRRIELLITEDPTEKMQRQLKDPRISPVIVPEHDPDHYQTGGPKAASFEEMWNG